MAHWAELLSRFILTLLSFTTLGTGIRCFIDPEFVPIKLFQLSAKDPSSIYFSHLFGTYTLLTSLIFSQSVIYLYVYPLTRIVVGCIISYLSLFALEIYIYKSITLTSPILYPIIINGLTLIWLLIFHLWKPYRLDISDPEGSALLKHGLPFRKQLIKKNKKAKNLNQKNF